MKKSKVILLLICMVCMLMAACGDKPAEESSSSSLPESSAEPTPESTPEPTEEPTPEPTEEPSSEAPVDKPESGPLSDDIYSFQVQIFGDVYQLPMTYEQFTAFGWTAKDDPADTLDSNRYTLFRFEKNGYVVTADVVNFDINAIEISACYVTALMLESYGLPDAAAVTVPGGAVLQKSTVKEVKELYGTPSYENETDRGSVTIKYQKDSYQVCEFVFFPETEGMNTDDIVLSKIDVENTVKPEDFVAGEVSTEVPAIVSKYEAPKEIGAEFGSWTTKYAGTVYQLPAPVSVFEADGWKIDEDGTEATVAGRSSGWVQMRKDNQKLRVIATNYTSSATAINNCFITKLHTDQLDCKVDMEIPMGIKTGMTEADFVKIFDSAEAKKKGLEKFEKKEESDLFAYYEISPEGSLVDTYEIVISKEDSMIYKIEMEYSPKFADFAEE
jgi:hypothetical protein